MSDPENQTPPVSGANDTQPPATPAPAAAPARQKPAKKANKPTHYRIVHSAVGPYHIDEVVGAEVFDDAQIKRLTDLGAIAEVPDPSEI